MHFYFKLELVLVTSYCGIIAKCSVDKLVNTSAVHVSAFCKTKCLYKNAKCDAYALFCGTNSHNQQAEDRPGVGFFQKIFYSL